MKVVDPAGDGPIAAYLQEITDHLRAIASSEADSIEAAGAKVADWVKKDEIVYVYGPGGHSNLAAQEIFFRAGGLSNISAILDAGTLLSNGARRSMAVERSPGYGRIVIKDNGLTEGDLLILVNAYGINAALIDAALAAKDAGVFVIGVSSRIHADSTAPDHPARHPSKRNLHDIVDLHVDTKVPIGDTALRLDGVPESFGAVSTFANAFAMNCIVASAIVALASQGISPPILRSGNAPGGDDVSKELWAKVGKRVRWL